MGKIESAPRALPIVKIPDKLKSGCYYHQSIGIGDKIDPQTLVELASDFKIKQIVQTSGADADLELMTAEVMLKSPDHFVENPLSTILDPANTSPEREKEIRTFIRPFKGGSDKKQILQGLSEFVFAVSSSASLNEEILFAADELFTNAVYNAPHVKFKQNGPGAPRTAEFGEAPELLPGELYAGYSDSRLVIGCTDNYGSLNPDHIVKMIMNCYEKGLRDAVNFGTGGAGLGTFLVYQSALSFYVGVTEGERTVVCCSFSLEKRAKVRSQLPKNLHICSGNPKAMG